LHFTDFSFEENVSNFVYDHAYLTLNLGIPDEKVRMFWPFVDKYRSETIRSMSEKGFRFEPLVDVAVKLFDAPGGEEWQHLSPGFWTKLAGGGLIVANIGLAVGTAAVGTPVACASCVAGVAGILA
jgi:hypothetical protein